MAGSPLPLSSTRHRLLMKSSETSKPMFTIFTTRRTLSIAFGFTFIFVSCTFFFLFKPSSSGHAFHFSSLLSHHFPTSSSLPHQATALFRASNGSLSVDNGNGESGILSLSQDSNLTSQSNPLSSDGSKENATHGKVDFHGKEQYDLKRESENQTRVVEKERPASSNVQTSGSKKRKKIEKWVEKMRRCNWFDGQWVRDDSYPLFEPGSCPHIDESFNCFLNGRPDSDYQKFRWQPTHCNIPRMNGKLMLEMLRGKRVVFVGDSLNRNMWESMVCVLQSSVEDKAKVFEASGREEFRTQDSYSFVFKDYNFSVEFFQSPFLVQEWEMEETNGSKKETLRLDMVERSSEKYKTADVLIFNTGHWWTHEKTSSGRDYYQEGSHIYDQLNVEEAFQKALTTWARWIEANTDPIKTLVFFRGYSVSHFRGGEWNSGGKCNGEIEPLKTENYFEADPPMVRTVETVVKGMKTPPVFYLNITRMTNFRRDAHPSIYRELSIAEEERRRVQDCSHWCLPGVPDTWNEIVYAYILFNHKQKQLQKQNNLG